jgi:sorbitol/mannitol transport system permease protein
MARAVSPRRKWITTAAAWFGGADHLLPGAVDDPDQLQDRSPAPSPCRRSSCSADWTLENYAEVWARSDYPRFFWNSVVISVGSTLLGLLIAIPAAWAMAFRARGRRPRTLLMWMLSTKMMPAVAVMIPLYLLFQRMGLIDTRSALSWR